MGQEWFESWFDSPYYHILYAHRDEEEARKLIDNMLHYLPLERGNRFLDVGCGRGRHARFVADKGFKVHGIDISPENIEAARKKSIPGAIFQVHDMRDILPENNFDVVLNLFTSFGYFDQDADLLKTLRNFSGALNDRGFLVLDYFNVHKTLKNLVPKEKIERGGITFHIERKTKNGFVLKKIRFNDQDETFTYEERVRLLTLTDFEGLFQESGFEIRFLCGDYSMTPFHPEESGRLIMIARKLK